MNLKSLRIVLSYGRSENIVEFHNDWTRVTEVVIEKAVRNNTYTMTKNRHLQSITICSTYIAYFLTASRSRWTAHDTKANSFTSDPLSKQKTIP